jgi:Protein of unknown function (DUF1566)
MQTRRVLTAGLCGLMAVGLCVFSTGQAQAASGNGPYYAEPSWSQKLPAATRFVVLTDWNSEAVLDRNTGLVWEKSPQTTIVTWHDARFTCINKNIGGQKGWRLPSIPELASLVDPSVVPPSPTLPAGHPFIQILSHVYWSASTNAEAPTHTWSVSFFNGDVFPYNKLNSFQVWCVRGGMTADAY